MTSRLNIEQAKGLSGFYFDIAKGSTLGAIGTSIAFNQLSLTIRISNIFLGLIISYICVKMALSILE